MLSQSYPVKMQGQFHDPWSNNWRSFVSLILFPSTCCARALVKTMRQYMTPVLD